MARAEVIVQLVRAGVSGDPRQFQKALGVLLAAERSKNTLLAERLEEFYKPKQTQLAGATAGLFHSVTPQRKLDDLILPELVREDVLELVEEQKRALELRGEGLEPRNRVLLVGPPGNGKTVLAEAIASELDVWFCSVRYDTVIGSFLGDTGKQLSKLFEAACMQPCVLFFDEAEGVGKERKDGHETGEIKRATSSLLLHIDRLPSHVVVVAATNHQEMLDRAVWRRFQLRWELPVPDAAGRRAWLDKHAASLEDSALSAIVETLEGGCFAELEQLVQDIQRKQILHPEELNIAGRCVDRWRVRVGPAKNAGT